MPILFTIIHDYMNNYYEPLMIVCHLIFPRRGTGSSRRPLLMQLEKTSHMAPPRECPTQRTPGFAASPSWFHTQRCGSKPTTSSDLMGFNPWNFWFNMGFSQQNSDLMSFNQGRLWFDSGFSLASILTSYLASILASSPALSLISYLAFFPTFYSLVNKHSYGKSPFLLGKSTLNGHLQ